MPKKRLKILFTTLYFPPAWGYGGPVRISHTYAKELVKRGHEVTVYTSDALDGDRRVKKKHNFFDGIEVFYLPNVSNSLAWKKFFLTLGFSKLLSKTINKFDLIHSFDFRIFQNIFVHYYALKNKKPYVISVFGQTNRGKGPLGVVKSFYDLLWGKNILQDASLVMAQNDHEKNDLIKFGLAKQKVAILPLAVDLNELKNHPSRGNFRQEFGIDSKNFLLLFLGRIHYLKGIDLLIKFLPAIQKRIKRTKLMIVGRDDGYLNVLQNMAKEKGLANSVIFTGPVYGKERIGAYQDANVFIITPRFFEETSLASLEAAACGTPIIVNDKCQVPYLEKYKAGITVNDSPKMLADAVFHVFKHHVEMGTRAKDMVKKEFSQEKVVDDLEKIYGQITN